MGLRPNWFVAFTALAVVMSAPDSPTSPDRDTGVPTVLPTVVPSHLPTPVPSPYPTFTRRPTLLPSVTPAPTVTFVPSLQPSHIPTFTPTPEPTATHAPTATGAPTYPTPPPTHSPTTWDPTTAPTLSPTTDLTGFGQQFAIGVSFIMIIIAYAIYSLNKPSELASRGLDYKMFRIREFRIEKRWACRFCGFVRNSASGPDCRQCGTNQLGEQEILPLHTSRGVITDRWLIRTPLVSNLSHKNSDNNILRERNKIGRKLTYESHTSNNNEVKSVSYGQGQRLVIWERSDWRFKNEFLNDFSRLSELPTALSLSEYGFIVCEKGLSGASLNVNQRQGSTTLKNNKWGGLRKSVTMANKSSNKIKEENVLEWVVAQGGIAEKEVGSNIADIAGGMGMSGTDPAWGISSNRKGNGISNNAGLYEDALSMRKCFYPEKVAWFYEQVGRLRNYALSENIQIEYATAYPNSVLRDSFALLGKISPQQVLASKYRVQLISGHSHSRSTEVEGEVEERWLQALFSQIIDPSCGVTIIGDSGALELMPVVLGSTEKHDAGRIAMFSALGRAIAMALVRRVFVNCNFSPCLCKLIVGEPITFLDLLHSDQALFQDLLRLMMMHPESVSQLNLSMPDTTTEGGDQMDLNGDVNSSYNSARDGIHWPGRGAAVGDIVTADSRQEYMFRKLEYQAFGKTRAEFTAMRKALFEVIPQTLFQVFDHREFSMLLNGYHKAHTEDTFTVSI